MSNVSEAYEEGFWNGVRTIVISGFVILFIVSIVMVIVGHFEQEAKQESKIRELNMELIDSYYKNMILEKKVQVYEAQNEQSS